MKRSSRYAGAASSAFGVTGCGQLLDQIERERLAWEQLLRAVGKERMEQPGASDTWGVKDVVSRTSAVIGYTFGHFHEEYEPALNA